MTTFVEIKDGSYRNEPVAGTYEVIAPWKVTASGSEQITVKDVTIGGKKYASARVKVSIENIRYVDAEGNEASAPILEQEGGNEDTVEVGTFEAQYRADENEEEAMDRIGRAFEILEELTVAAKDGIVNAMIVSGAPGIGKSYGVHTTLRDGSLLHDLGANDKYEVVKGNVTPIALYQKLYNHRDADHVLVFDDCDVVLEDPICLNLLKAVLDTGEKRTVSWLSESSALKAADIPDRFDFEGSIIFLSNVDFDNVRAGSKMGRHLEALRSRVLYLDLEINTIEDVLLRIKQVVYTGGMLDKFGFDQATKDEVLSFVEKNAEHFHRLDLRSVLKIAMLRKSSPANWQEYSIATTMKKEAQFMWRLEQKRQEAKKEAVA